MHPILKVTYSLVLLGVFSSQLCLPVPGAALLMLAGGLARSGQMHVAWILAVSVLGCLGGDLIWFEAGRIWGSQVLRVVCGFSDDPHYCAEKARTKFRRSGLPSLLIAKFIPGYDGVAPPLAGLEGASRNSFLLYDSGGALLWSAAYVGIGYLFADRLEAVTAAMEKFGSAIGVAVGIPLLAYVTLRAWRLLTMLRYLRLRRITPLLLHQKLEAGERIVVIDLIRFEDEPEDLSGIAGAVRLDPARLRSKSRVLNPEGLEIVLYCTTSGELTSARVALAMRKKGLTGVWILDGGLTAWRKEGLPVTHRLSTEEEATERFGLKVIEMKSR